MKYNIGDTAWEVQWTTDVPLDELGDCIPDAGVDHYEIFPDEAAAWRRAVEVYPNDFWGSVRVAKQILVWDEDSRKPAWQDLADADFYDGPDA